MNAETIKQFLVGLGFGVDEASLAKFNKAIAGAALKVTALYVATQAMAAGIFAGIAKISEGFEQMGYEYRIIAPAINKALLLRRAMLQAYQAAGINVVEAVKQSVLFNYSLAKTKFALEAIYKSVEIIYTQVALPILTQQMDKFRTQIFANMPKIQNALEKMVKFIFKAFEATIILGERLYHILGTVWSFFVKLDEATDGWSTKIFLAIAAWKLLNLSFLATPLGMILTGFLALLALWDDFQVFLEGGKSLINWGSEAAKAMTGIAVAAGVVAAAIAAVNIVVGILSAELSVAAIAAAVLEAPFWAIAAAIAAVVAIVTLADEKWKIFGGHLSGFFSGIGGAALNFLGGAHPQAATAGAGSAGSQPQPLVHNIPSTNQKINQETNILVQGSADAQATGKAVAAEQGKVNFDLVRNLRGATQ